VETYGIGARIVQIFQNNSSILCTLNTQKQDRQQANFAKNAREMKKETIVKQINFKNLDCLKNSNTERR